MTNDELKEAFMKQCPVIYRNTSGVDILYEKINAVIYRKEPHGSGISVCAELQDKNGRSTLTCLAKDIYMPE